MDYTEVSTTTSSMDECLFQSPSIEASLKDANRLFFLGRYLQALAIYEKLENSIQEEKNPSLKSEILLKMGINYYKQGLFTKSIQKVEKCLSIQKKLEKQDQEILTKCYCCLADTHILLDNYKQATECLEEAIKISQKCENNKVRVTHLGVTENQMGELLMRQGKYQQSLDKLEKALDLLSPFPDSLEISKAYYDLGTLYNFLANYTQALLCLKRALDIREKVYGRRHPEVAMVQNIIGNVLLNQGKYKEAMNYYESSLKTRLEYLGNDHPSVASSYNNIAIAYYDQGEYTFSLINYKRSLEIRCVCYGENHPDVAASYNNIGALYYDLKKYDLALENYEKALAIRLRYYGENHPDIAASYNNLANVYQDRHDNEKSLENHEKSLKIKKMCFGEKHPEVATSYNNLGILYHNQGQNLEAFKSYIKALNIRVEFFGKAHTSIADCAFNLALLFYDKKDISLSKQLFQKSQQIYKHVFGTSHTSTQDTEVQSAFVEKQLCVHDFQNSLIDEI